MSEERDPLDEREADSQVVRDKRLLEDMENDRQRAELGRLLDDVAVRDFLWRTIERCGTLHEAFDANYGKMAYTSGRQSVGRMLMAEINEANPRAWLDMQLKAGELVAAEKRMAALKRQRARSP